jgi:hypothetical protein
MEQLHRLDLHNTAAYVYPDLAGNVSSEYIIVRSTVDM